MNCIICGKSFKKSLNTHRILCGSVKCKKIRANQLYKNYFNKQTLIKKCVLCGKTKNIEEHHIIERSYLYHKRSGIMYLCKQHHLDIHKYYKRIRTMGYQIK